MTESIWNVTKYSSLKWKWSKTWWYGERNFLHGEKREKLLGICLLHFKPTVITRISRWKSFRRTTFGANKHHNKIRTCCIYRMQLLAIEIWPNNRLRKMSEEGQRNSSSHGETLNKRELQNKFRMPMSKTLLSEINCMVCFIAITLITVGSCKIRRIIWIYLRAISEYQFLRILRKRNVCFVWNDEIWSFFGQLISMWCWWWINKTVIICSTQIRIFVCFEANVKS